MEPNHELSAQKPSQIKSRESKMDAAIGGEKVVTSAMDAFNRSMRTKSSNVRENMDLFLFIHEVFAGKDVDTLYKIKLPSLPIFDIKPPSLTEELLSPIFEFHKDKYPNTMGCVHFDSKLYFYGGYCGSPHAIDKDKNLGLDVDLTNQVFSPKVYVLDVGNASDQIVLKQCPSMATGKAKPLAFVAKGMIYVIGGSVSRMSFKFSNSLIRRFERFNPVEGTWEVLDDTPLQGLWTCVGATLVNNHDKVILIGWVDNRIIHLVYDIQHDKWDTEPTSIKLSPYSVLHVGEFDESYGQYLYGIVPYKYLPIKIGPLKELDNIHKLSALVDMSIVDTPTPMEWKMKAFYHVVRGNNPLARMPYLGAGHFCYVTTSETCPGDELPYLCPHTRKVSLTIFKELSNDYQAAIEGEGKGSQPFPFLAKLLYSKDYAMKMNFRCGSNLAGCFIVDHDRVDVDGEKKTSEVALAV